MTDNGIITAAFLLMIGYIFGNLFRSRAVYLPYSFDEFLQTLKKYIERKITK